jgi:hypothetical protein
MIADCLVQGNKDTMNCLRVAINCAVREFARVLKHIAGDGCRQMVVNDETVRPRWIRPEGASHEVLTNTTIRHSTSRTAYLVD